MERGLSGAELLELLSRLPHVDDDFADDVRSLATVLLDPYEASEE